MRGDLEVRQRRLLPASRQQVWDAWTRPDEMVRWFAPLGMRTVTVEADVRVGGAFRISMEVGGGMETFVPQRDGIVVATGVYMELVEPSTLAFSWGWEDFDEVSEVRIELTGVGEQTELLLVHRQLTSVASQEFHDTGWSLTFDHLAQRLPNASMR